MTLMERFACGHVHGEWGEGAIQPPRLELGYKIKRQLRLIRSLEFRSTPLIEKVYFHSGGKWVCEVQSWPAQEGRAPVL